MTNMQVVYDVVNAERAAMRQGTHKLRCSEVSGGGKKPWRQKVQDAHDKDL